MYYINIVNNNNMKNKELNKVETKAIELINMYFHDKTDKGGNSYLDHLWNVAGAIEREASIEVVDRQSSKGIFYQKAFIVALLHDILEDTDTTEEELYKIGCDDEIVKAVKSVTRKQEEKYYFDFIERASQNDIGRLVKKYDLEDNMDIRRLKTFGDYEQKRLKKYWYSWMFLKGEITSVMANNAIHPDRLLR